MHWHFGQVKIQRVDDKMVCGNETVACGWAELFDGNLIGAAYVMYNAAFMGWTVAILFFIYQFMLLLKTRNLTLSWVTGLIFISLYATSTFVEAASVQIMFVLLVFELGGVLYLSFWK